MPDNTPRNFSSSERITVGHINTTWGLKGHVRVTPLTSNEDRFVEGAEFYVGGGRHRILKVVQPQGYPIIQFEGFENRTRGESLRNTVIEIDADELPPLPEGEYYVDDLVGLTIVTTEGEPVGTLAEVLTTGANDVYVVKRPEAKDVLIPAIPDVITTVDLEARQMTIDPLPGLLDG